MKIVSKSVDIGGRPLTLEVGRFAEQATSAVLARYGDTMVLSSVVCSSPNPGLSYFPLSVEYLERLYAGGRIKGSRWVKREGRPSDDAILTARLVDRSIRPLFPKGFKNETQVTITVLSVDGENEPDILSIIATSAAISISQIPWNGPVGALRVGYVKNNGESSYMSNPAANELSFSEMDMVVTSTPQKVLMLEAGIKQLPEKTVLGGIKFGHEENQKIIKLIENLAEAIGKKKMDYIDHQPDPKLIKILEKEYAKEIDEVLEKKVAKEVEGDEMVALVAVIVEKYGEEHEKKQIEGALDTIAKKKMREKVLKEGKRADGRDIKTIRPIEVEVGLLPRTHGSAMFKRGQTQVLTVATLGSPSLEQLIESPEGETAKSYMHHYSMPPYSVGETGRVGFPSRREIGHGALAERALMPAIPAADKFPYTLRLVSEVMSSNGSTSMAATCGSTLALMDAGVPITSPVAGIAMGLIADKEKPASPAGRYVILTDILGLEDFGGDMDFKVAGTKEGVTAIQLDVKIDGLTMEIIEETLKRAYDGRLYILEKMLSVMPEARKQLSQYAPKVSIITVPQEKIGEVIGPGGKVIRQIISVTGCDVNVDDDGRVTISGTDAQAVEKAYNWVAGIIKEAQPGEIYEGVVKRILPFGAFVEILPGKEGMVHVSQMSTGFVNKPEDVVEIGKQVKVRVYEVDDQGRINLSMLFGEDAEKNPPRKRERSAGPRGPRRRF
ncbi:polyribonucleotide nucleotidyltransferase [Candidatus Gottesmanbacteria bacterium]|nr:polyribonucleotide nucleotidyltransferase [Candidatus Gottesmanbacteria bacterium]